MEDVLKDQECQTMDVDSVPQKIEKVIEPVINSQLSNEQKVEQVGQIMAGFIAISQESFSGPMPHPDILRGYKELISDAPERILKMAEQEQIHRMMIEKQVLEQNGNNIKEAAKANRLSQIFAFFLTVLLIIAGVLLTIVGYVAVGITIFGTTIVALAAVFITGKSIRQSKKKEQLK